MKRWPYLLLASILLPQSLLASDSAKEQEAISRMQHAVAKTNIFDLPSFLMKANLQVENRGKLIDGTYQLLWNGPDQWREEISLPAYNEVQVGGKGMRWVQRSTDFIPLAIYDMRRALGFGSGSAGTGSGSRVWSLVQLGLTGKDKVKKTRERKQHGDTLTCFEIENEHKESSEICLHDSTDTIARNPSSYGDADFQPVGGKLYPRFLSFLREGKTLAKVNVSELTTPGQFPPNAFTPPAGVPAQAGCMNPTLPRLVKRQTPEYPSNARAQHVQGTVSFDAMIGADGVPRIQEVIESPSPDLQASSLRALNQWRYDPALCNGQPVEVETVLQINYTLSY